MKTSQPLTATELDTLAVMLDSSGQHMADARDRAGNLAIDGKTLRAMHTEAVAGFYDIQLRAPGGLTRDLTIL